MSKFVEWAQKQKYILLDSSMSLGLEKRGVDLDNQLWTADALNYHPDLIADVHRAYFDAGSNISSLDTYQASVPGLTDAGYSKEQATTLLQNAVHAGRRGRQASQAPQTKWLAAAIGPYGAYLANGAEYRGDYNLSTQQYIDFHKQRIQILLASGVDLVMVKTQPNFKEIKTVVKYLQNYAVPLTVTCTLKDANHLADGTPITKVQDFLEQQPNVIAYGANCVDPKLITPLIKNFIAHRANHKDFITFPNLGAKYDPTVKQWSDPGISSEAFNQLAQQWVQLGVKYIGGCCCMSEEKQRALHAMLEKIAN